MVTLFGDVTDLNIPHIEEKIKGFPLKAKSFQNTAPYQKLRGGGPSTPLPLYHGGGMTLPVRPRIKIASLNPPSPIALPQSRKRWPWVPCVKA